MNWEAMGAVLVRLGAKVGVIVRQNRFCWLICLSLLAIAAPGFGDPVSPAGLSAIAQLRIPRLAIDVPVFDGTHRTTLDRGAGLVTGTTALGQTGNSVVSAHRDKHFKPLQHAQVGDVIEVEIGDEVQSFEVEEIFITDPLDLGVLDPTTSQVLTLITCFPFDYQGYAPDRFIIRARRNNSR
jgi:sortase A